MRENNVNKLFLIFLIILFFVNLAQAIFTGIHYDEVYYSIWGKNLDWGYFDHPPAVAVITYLGSLFFEGNLSVRFFTILLHLGTILLIWNTLEEKYRQSEKLVYLFFIIATSLTMFSVYGFTTTPDVPLIFFASLFLFGYQRFLEESKWIDVLLMSIAMAGMLYSKYHGALFIGLIILSNLKLLLNIRFWISGILAILLLIPHFWWQYIHDFSSFKFHLSVRSLGFDIKYVLEFLPGQLGVFNPFIFGVMLFILWKYRAINPFERTLYFLIIGIVGFFALSTYRGRAEAHWTSVASVPVFIVLMIKAVEQEKVQKYVRKYVAFSLILIVIARILLVTNVSKKVGYEDREPLYRAMEKLAGNAPVVFNSSFQDASSYEFYTGKPATTIGAMENRQTQYDLWQREQNMLEKKAFVILENGMEGLENNPFHKYKIGNDFQGFFVEDWQVSNRLKINYDLEKDILKTGEWIEMPIEIENPTQHSIDFQHKDFPIDLRVTFLILKRNYVIEKAEFSKPLGKIKPLEKVKGVLKFKVPDDLEERTYKFSVITHSPFGHTLNSLFKNVEIEK